MDNIPVFELKLCLLMLTFGSFCVFFSNLTFSYLLCTSLDSGSYAQSSSCKLESILKDLVQMWTTKSSRWFVLYILSVCFTFLLSHYGLVYGLILSSVDLTELHTYLMAAWQDTFIGIMTEWIVVKSWAWFINPNFYWLEQSSTAQET